MPNGNPGSLAWRQYEVKLTSGRTAILGFSLGDPGHATMARIRDEHDACNLGLLVVLDDPDSIEEVVLWFQQATSLSLLSQNGNVMIGDAVNALLPRCFAVLFDEMKESRARSRRRPAGAGPRPGDRNVH